MFVPKTKHTKPKRSTGTQFFLKNGVRYIGLFVQLFDGRFFTGSTVNSTSQELFESREPDNEEDTVALSDLRTVNLQPPSQRERASGRYQRYFLKDTRTSKIVEVGVEDYNQARNQNSRQRASLPWQIEGPDEDTYINGYLYTGVKTNNKKTVDEANKTMSGLTDYISEDYTKFNKSVTVQGDTASTRPDNTQSFYIPSPSKKL
jgi:hypothetical protein